MNVSSAFIGLNPQIKLPSQRNASLYGQKHIENPIPKRAMCHDVPVPKLAPVPCSALGHTNPRVSVPSGCWEAHQKVTHSSQLPPLKSTMGKPPVSPTGTPQQLQTRRDPHARDAHTVKDSTCLRASLTDRRATGRERSGACCRSPRSSELAVAFKLKTSPLLTACPLEQTTIKTTAQK